ncbi:MAG: response regulator [Lachnospiraceae bacterium]|nr:response regulator [Lachnospiraceae bacterium]
MKVLFLDSEPLVRKKLQNMIPWGQYGFTEFWEADCCADALELIAAENPELILTDLYLKDMSGMMLIREVRKNDYNARIIIISEDSDFADAKLAINSGVTAYLNKPADPEDLSWAVMRVVDEIQKTKLISIYYEQSAMLSKNNLLSNILIGNMTYVKEMESIFHIELDSDYYRLISFTLPESADNSNIWDEALLHLKNCLSVTFSESRLVLIALNPGQEQFILRQMKSCQENYPPYDALLGIISSQAGSHTELSVLYSEIRRIDQNLYYYKEKQSDLLYADALSQRLDKIQQTDLDLIRFTENMIHNILLLQSTELEEALLSLHDFLSLRKPHRDSTQFILMNCYAQVVSALTEYYPQLEFEMAGSKDLTSHLSYDRYLCDSISYLNDQFQKAISFIRNESRKKPCQRICQYIDRNYSAPLKLNTLADLLGYNSAYLGKLFFREMGVSFHTYLDKIRIQKASEYLKKGVPVITTSEFSGFTNPDYFTKKFKKYMGMLPSTYRAQYLNESPVHFTPPPNKNSR